MDAIIVMGGWRGKISRARDLLLRSVDRQRLLDLLVLFPLFPLLLALNCPTSFYPFHLLTTSAVSCTMQNNNQLNS